MKQQTKLMRASIVMAGMLGSSAAYAAEGHVGGKGAAKQVIVSTNLSALVEEGTDVSISIATGVLNQIEKISKKASPDVPLKRQWQKDGHDMPGKTEDTLALPNVGFSDVGTYTLVLSGSAEQQSAP